MSNRRTYAHKFAGESPTPELHYGKCWAGPIDLIEELGGRPGFVRPAAINMIGAPVSGELVIVLRGSKFRQVSENGTAEVDAVELLRETYPGGKCEFHGTEPKFEDPAFQVLWGLARANVSNKMNENDIRWLYGQN